MALPEMKEVAEELKDSLVMVSITKDTDKTWREASLSYPVSWYNLSDGRGALTLSTQYGLTGMPFYVIISPDGIILGNKFGYGPGSIRSYVKEYIR